MKMKVNERNMGMVCGRINKFLSKPTKEYLGKRQVAVGSETVKCDDGFSFKRPVYEERDCYKAFIGRCEEHWRRKEIRKKTDASKDDKLIASSVLLAVGNDYDTNCIPIRAGFVVEITGEKMVIKENDIFHYYTGIRGEVIRSREKDASTYRTFYHMPYDEKEILELQRHAIYSGGFDAITANYYYGGSFNDYFESSYMVDECMDAMRSIEGLFTSMIDEDFSADCEKLENSEDICGREVTFFCNPSAFKDGVPGDIEDKIYILIDGRKFYDIIDAVLYLVRDDDPYDEDLGDYLD